MTVAALLACTLSLAVGPLEDLEQARILANDDPAKFAGSLADAIDGFEHDLTLAGDAEAQRMRIRALLTLSRAYLATERTEEANAAMDRTIRAALGAEVPATDFGPSLSDLYQARKAALGEPGQLTVTCRETCEVIVNANAIEPGTRPLPPGTYAVVVGAPGGDDALRTEVTVTSSDSAQLVWPRAPQAPSPEPAPPSSADLDVDRPRAGGREGRLLPRWAEITGMVVGTAAVGAGAALLAIDGTCPGGGDPSDGDECPDLYETTAAGAATLAVGGSLLITSGALLIVDEVRTRDGGKQTVLGLGWRGRF